MVSLVKQYYDKGEGTPDSTYYNMALDLFPNLNLPKWEDAASLDTISYVNNPDDLELNAENANYYFNNAQDVISKFIESNNEEFMKRQNATIGSTLNLFPSLFIKNS